MIYIFPPNYLLPTQTAGGNADNEGSDTEEDDDDDDDTDADTDDDDDDNSNNNNGIGGAEIDAPDVYHAKVQGLRKEFLSEFSNEEVAEIWQANNFMLFASNCARNTFLDPRINDGALLRFVQFITCTYLNLTSRPIVERSSRRCGSLPEPPDLQRAKPFVERSMQLGSRPFRRRLARYCGLLSRERLHRPLVTHGYVGPCHKPESDPGRQG